MGEPLYKLVVERGHCGGICCFICGKETVQFVHKQVYNKWLDGPGFPFRISEKPICGNKCLDAYILMK